MTAHDLIFYENRSTPEVVSKGAKGNPKKGYGKQTRRRPATAAEEKQMRNGQWLRVDQSGKKGGEKGYKKSRYRPGLVSAASVELLGINGRHALFGDNTGMAVTVDIDDDRTFAVSPRAAVPMTSWDAPNPAWVNTSSYVAAARAFSDGGAAGVGDVTVLKGQRRFAVPHRVRAVALSALDAVGHSAELGPSMIVARALASTSGVQIETVRHMDEFFSHHADSAEPADVLNLWGGEAGRRWAANIMRSEQLALRAAAVAQDDDTDDLGDMITEQEALGDPDEMETESHPEVDHPENAEPEDTADELNGETWDADEPHPFLPDDGDDYLCAICQGTEDILIHSLDLLGQEADTSDPSSTPAEPARPAASSDDAAPASPDTANELPDDEDTKKKPDAFAAIGTRPSFFATANDDGAFTTLYGRTNSDWNRWNRTRRSWIPTAAQNPGELFALDDHTAAQLSKVSELNTFDPVEQALFEDAGMFFSLNVGGEEIDLDDVDFGAQITDGDITQPTGLFLVGEEGACWSWDADNGEWTQSGADCPADLVAVDLDVAVQLVGQLTNTELPMAEVLDNFTRAAVIVNSGQHSPLTADGEYSPEERSKNASQQFRDAGGRFAKTGAVVHVNDNTTGEVTGVNVRNKTVRVREANGRVRDLRWDAVTKIGEVGDGAAGDAATGDIPRNSDGTPKLDLEGIQGQPRASKNTPKATLPKLLPPMDAGTLRKVVSNYQQYIEQERRRQLQDFADLTPETTDVAPLFLALVDELDNTAVLDLLALIPKTKTTTDVALYKRDRGGWVPAPDLLNKMRSITPPPLVTLDADTYKQVLEQVDTFYESTNPKDDPVTASASSVPPLIMWTDDGRLIPALATALTAAGVPGVADTPSDVAATRRLERYWLRGEGAAKIRWNSPGDWTRCVRNLTKHMGERARGYCQNLHKKATGLYTGDKRHLRASGWGTDSVATGLGADGSAMLLSVPTAVLASAAEMAAVGENRALVTISVPTLDDLDRLSARDAGHDLRIGERFLVAGGDGSYTVRVLDPVDTLGWSGRDATLVQRGESPTRLMIKKG